jgi:hypothetical protein
MDARMNGFTPDEYVGLTQSVIFEVRNFLVASIGYGELTLRELDPSHPAYVHCSAALHAAEAAFAAVKRFDHEAHRRGFPAAKKAQDNSDANS